LFGLGAIINIKTLFYELIKSVNDDAFVNAKRQENVGGVAEYDAGAETKIK